jgi:hypothetical protein
MRLANQSPLTHREEELGSKWLKMGIWDAVLLCWFSIRVRSRVFVMLWRSSWRPLRISMRKAERIAEKRPA